MRERKHKIDTPQRAYAGVSQWQTTPITVEYDETTHQVSIFQGSVYLVYPIQTWFELVRSVNLVLPEPLAALAHRVRAEKAARDRDEKAARAEAGVTA